MATATLSSNAMATTTITTTTHPDSEPFQNGLASSNQNNNVSTKKTGLRKPQISVEHADGLEVIEDGARIGAAQVIAKLSPISRRHAQKRALLKQEQLRQQQQQEEEQQEGGGDHLKVIGGAPRMGKSTSLPSGASLEQFLETRQSPGPQSVESSACNSSEVSADEDNDFGHDSRALSPDLYPDDDISSGLSSDEESSTVVSPLIIPSVIDPDDEVFGDIDICNEADTKLVDWSFNVFVPACKTLLYHCADGNDSELASGQILADLRSLSNTINFFCTEQQRLSGQVKINSRGISSSLSTDRFARIYKDKAKNLEPQQANSNTASMSSESSGFESQDSQYDRSYAVKILRSVSQSLIAPLLRDSDDGGFTSDLYKSIVQAIQKIAWKVEACLSFNDPSKQFDIYTKIFDEEQKRKLSVMMIRALPPEEPTLKNTAGRSSRTSSFSSSNLNSTTKDENLLNPEKELGRVIRRTPSGRARPAGMLIDPKTVEIKQDCLEELEESRKSSSIEFENQFDMSFKLEDPPGGAGKLRRINTIASPDRKLRISTNWNSFDEQAPKESSPHYFRPTHHRRTTISLSRKEVSKLGLTTVRRVDDSIAALNQGSTGLIEATGQNQGEGVEMEKVKSRLQEVLDGRAMRNRSASTSDLLEDTSEASASDRSRNHSFQVDKEALSPSATKKKYSLESPTLDKNLVKSYTPLKYQTSNPTLSNDSQEFPGDWTLIQDPGMPRDGTPPGLKPSKYPKSNRKSSRAKKALDKSLSASGKFRERVMKTAQALRRGSISYSSSKKKHLSSSVVAGSMDQLLEDPTQKKGSEAARKFAESESRTVAQSEPASPLPKSETMPSKHRGKGTLSRIRPKSSKSVSASNTLSRRKKSSTSSAKSGFLANRPDAEGVAALTESIYALSNNAVQPSPSDIEDQLLITVDFSSKIPAKSKLHKKRSSIISSSSSSLWYAITITTTMKQFGRKHFTILRTIKQVITLYDAINTSHPSFASSLPSKPEKKAGLKLQKQQLEDFLNYISRTPVLRSSKPFVVFLMPDDEFGNFTENSEISFDLLMTFYTPDMYPGPPGSHNELQVVAPEDVPSKYSPSPSRSRRSSALPKKGTLHYVKKEGREDNSTFVIREEGQDALIVACEEDRYVVVAGTFEKLVEQLACEEKPDPRFVMTFLLGYRHFSNTMDLLTLLLRRFYMAVAPDATEEELSYAEKWRYVIQLRVLDILTYWLKKCWPDFYRDSVVLEKIREFIEQLKASPDTNFQLAGTNLEKVLSDKLSTSDQQYSVCSTPTADHAPSRSRPSGLDRTISADAAHSRATCTDAPTTSSSLTADMPRPRGSRAGGGALDIVIISAIQLARQLTLIELEALRTIDIHELVVYTWEANSPKNKPYRKHIDQYIARFNKLSFWIASEICSITDAKTRGVLIEKFIEVAKHCQELKNFNSTISIMSGLSLAAVRRLKKSWDFVGERPRKNFEKMSIIMSPTNNHNSYRKLLSTVNRRDPCIPYFGVFMRDLTFFNDGNHKTLKNGLINFSKLRTMVYKFEELKRYQRSKYFFPPEDKVQEFCRNMWCLSESDLYDTSLEVEPREVQPSSSSTSAATPSLHAQHSRDTLSEPHPTPERDETDV